MSRAGDKSETEMPQALRDFPIFNCLVQERRLVSFANRLDDIGVITIGDFVDRGTDNIFKSIRTTENNRRKVRRILASFDL